MKQYVSLLLLVLVYSYCNAQIPEFKLFKIGETEEELLGQSSLVDMDKDGDLDLVVGSSGGSVWWFEYQAADKWVRHLIGDHCLTDKGGITIDIDGDGWLDHVAGGTWYRNTGDPKKPFERYENGAIYAYDMIAGDINGDGIQDIVAMSQQEGLFWYNYSAAPKKKWKKVRIGDGVTGGIAPYGIADMDNDGDNDIVRSNVWYENLNGDGSKWVIHRTISYVESLGKFANSSRVFVLDMDKDGDTDIIQAMSNNAKCKLAWHSNKDGKGINWFTHHIAFETTQDLHSLCVADFDNDNDLDIFSGAGPMTSDLRKRCFIWENADGKGTSWIQHEILSGYESIDAVCGDVDGDGDIDICIKPWKGNEVYYLQNMK
ncbi:MAG: VCBS repeat-containing protein [Bacteroidales bacterium]